jgi:hypothetical protein
VSRTCHVRDDGWNDPTITAGHIADATAGVGVDRSTVERAMGNSVYLRA